jgi:hypothetical protein
MNVTATLIGVTVVKCMTSPTLKERRRDNGRIAQVSQFDSGEDGAMRHGKRMGVITYADSSGNPDCHVHC